MTIKEFLMYTTKLIKNKGDRMENEISKKNKTKNLLLLCGGLVICGGFICGGAIISGMSQISPKVGIESGRHYLSTNKENKRADSFKTEQIKNNSNFEKTSNNISNYGIASNDIASETQQKITILPMIFVTPSKQQKYFMVMEQKNKNNKID